VARALWLLLLALPAVAVQKPAAPPAEKPPEHALPEEEDESAKPKEYTFNPIQAENELKIARYYMKKGSSKAVALRCEEALKWNPQSADAYLLLGEAREKLRENKAAAEAYKKFLELAGDSKAAPDVRKRLEKLGSKPS
jgi:outer membrane protein assembly factor BamD (BamD/ComL family)